MNKSSSKFGYRKQEPIQADGTGDGAVLGWQHRRERNGDPIAKETKDAIQATKRANFKTKMAGINQLSIAHENAADAHRDAGYAHENAAEISKDIGDDDAEHFHNKQANLHAIQTEYHELMAKELSSRNANGKNGLQSGGPGSGRHPGEINWGEKMAGLIAKSSPACAKTIKALIAATAAESPNDLSSAANAASEGAHAESDDAHKSGDHKKHRSAAKSHKAARVAHGMAYRAHTEAGSDQSVLDNHLKQMADHSAAVDEHHDIADQLQSCGTTMARSAVRSAHDAIVAQGTEPTLEAIGNVLEAAGTKMSQDQIAKALAASIGDADSGESDGTETSNTAYEQGQKADSEDENPYQDGTDECDAWIKGFRDAHSPTGGTDNNLGSDARANGKRGLNAAVGDTDTGKDENSETSNTAFYEGQQAESVDENPYDPGTDEYDAWMSGFNDAHEGTGGVDDTLSPEESIIDFFARGFGKRGLESGGPGSGRHKISNPVKKDGEYQVKWMTDGKRDEGKTYYTDDKEDAYNTHAMMVKQAEKMNEAEGGHHDPAQSSKTPGDLGNYAAREEGKTKDELEDNTEAASRKANRLTESGAEKGEVSKAHSDAASAHDDASHAYPAGSNDHKYHLFSRDVHSAMSQGASHKDAVTKAWGEALKRNPPVMKGSRASSLTNKSAIEANYISDASLNAVDNNEKIVKGIHDVVNGGEGEVIRSDVNTSGRSTDGGGRHVIRVQAHGKPDYKSGLYRFNVIADHFPDTGENQLHIGGEVHDKALEAKCIPDGAKFVRQEGGARNMHIYELPKTAVDQQQVQTRQCGESGLESGGPGSGRRPGTGSLANQIKGWESRRNQNGDVVSPKSQVANKSSMDAIKKTNLLLDSDNLADHVKVVNANRKAEFDHMAAAAAAHGQRDVDSTKFHDMMASSHRYVADITTNYINSAKSLRGLKSGSAADIEQSRDSLNASATVALECYSSPTALKSLATEEGVIMVMPGGTHTITPSQGGRPVTVCLTVDAQAAIALENQRQSLTAKGKKPFFSIQHSTEVAAFWPKKFFWDTRVDATGATVSGVWAEGEWTASGKAARDGKDFRTFSPTFFVNAVRNDPDNPSIVVCNDEARANMGALENDPAFQAMSPLWARHMNDPKRTAVRVAHDELVASGKTPTLVDVVNEANKNNGLALTEDEAAVYLID